MESKIKYKLHLKQCWKSVKKKSLPQFPLEGKTLPILGRVFSKDFPSLDINNHFRDYKLLLNYFKNYF